MRNRIQLNFIFIMRDAEPDPAQLHIAFCIEKIYYVEISSDPDLAFFLDGRIWI